MKATRMNKRMTAFVSRFVLVLAMTALLLTGCGASSDYRTEMAMPEAAAPMEAPMMDEMKGNSITTWVIENVKP